MQAALINPDIFAYEEDSSVYTLRGWLSGDVIFTRTDKTRTYTWPCKRDAGTIPQQDPDNLVAAGWNYLGGKPQIPWGKSTGFYTERYELDGGEVYP